MIWISRLEKAVNKNSFVYLKTLRAPRRWSEQG